MRFLSLLPRLAAAAPSPAAPPPPAPPARQAPADPPPATPAAAAIDLNSKLINVPGMSWNVYGENQAAKRLEKEGPKGYPAIRVTVAKAGKNAWDAGAVSVVPKPVGAGDAVLVAVY